MERKSVFRGLGRSLGWALAAALSSGCLKENVLRQEAAGMEVPVENKVSVGSSSSGTNVQVLYAGQTIDAGQVLYDDVDTNGDMVDDALQVTYLSGNGWELTEAQFFVGKSLSELPVNKSGNPQPGLFPYKSGTLVAANRHQFTVPFSVLGYACPNGSIGNFYVAAHASLRKPNGDGSYQTESGWGNGLRLVQRGNWAMYNMLYVTCDVNTPPAQATTETAFAFDGDQSGCFRNYSEFLDNPQRWGWTNGPYGPGSYTFKIFGGAGLCDISKGVYVGDLKVVYDGSTAKVTYSLTGSDPKTDMPYTLREAHLFVGKEEFPRITSGNQAGQFTISPGRFPLKASGLTGQTQSFTVNNLSGDIYIIAHAVVHGFPDE